MAEDLVSGRGASRFVVNTPSRKLIEAQGRMSEFQGKAAANQQLQAKAASLLPDFQTISDSLLEYDLHTADAKKVRGQLDSVTSTYMDAYSQDPFFTFTPEGRGLAKKMQKIITNPELMKAQDLKKQNDKELEKAQTEGVLDKILVSAEGIGVIRDGRKMYVDKPKETDQVLTVNDDYQYTNNVLGSAGGKYIVPVRSFDKAIASVRSAFAQVGDTEWKKENIDPEALLSSISSGKSNKHQIDTVVNLLTSKGGMAIEDWNTLKSEYLSNIIGGEVDGDFTEQSAKQAVIETIMATGRAKTSSASGLTFNENPLIGAKTKGGGADKGAVMSDIERSFYGLNGTRSRVAATAQGVVSTQDGRVIGAGMFQNAPVEAFREDQGVKFKSYKVKDLPLFSHASDNMLVISATTGDLLKLPPDAWKHGVLGDGTGGENETPAFVTHAIGPDKKIIPLNIASQIQSSIEKQEKIKPEHRKYMSTNEAGTPVLKYGQFADGVMYIPKKNEAWGSDIDTTASSNLLEKNGFSTAKTSEGIKFINEHSGTAKDVLESGEVFTPDEYYKIRFMTPMDSYFQIRGAGGENVYGKREDAELGVGDFQPQEVQVNPDLLDDKAFKPNLKQPSKTKLSEVK